MPSARSVAAEVAPRVLLAAFALLGLEACMGYRTPLQRKHQAPPATADAAGVTVEPDAAQDPGPASQPDTATDPARDYPPDVPTDPARDYAPDAPSDPSPEVQRDLATDPAIERPRSPLNCILGEKYILALGGDEQLYRLDTTTLTLTSITQAVCHGDGLNSLTTSPLGPAYVSTQNGDLCQVDLTTFATTPTSFNPADVDYNSFGMALLADDAAPAGQTLFIAVADSVYKNRLDRVDLTTFQISEVGPILPVVDWAELTAGPNRELYGFSIGTSSSLLLNIDPNNGSAIDVTKVPAGFAAAAFALVYWQEAFYLFLGPSGASSGNNTVYRYRKGDAQVATIGTLPVAIIGAGVTICQ